MMTLRSWVAVLPLALLAAPVYGQEPVVAGRIKVVAGEAFVVRAGGEVIPAQPGQPIYQADTLRTGSDGRLGVTLQDDTRVSLGASSEVRVDRFAFAPAEGQIGFVLRIARGVMAYVSGRIAKLSPDSIRLETPAAIVGVRGTTLALRVTE